jgi:RNA recognition motif-containing protein
MNNNTIEVSGLSNKTSVQDIEDLFGKFGQIEEITRIDDNTVVVKYQDYRDAREALQFNQRQLDRNIINVNFYEEKTPINSSLIRRENVIDNTKLLISNLPRRTTIIDLKDLFEEYGPIENVTMIDESNNTAIIEFEDSRDAQDALDLNKQRYHDNIITVKIYEENSRSNSPLRKIKKDYWDIIPHFSNFEKLYTFPDIPYFQLTTVSKELENEPYAIKDSGYRPVLRIRKKLFKFEIHPKYGKAYTTVDSYPEFISIISTIDTEENYPDKLITNYSVIDVYENYGLEITYSYLKYIYYNPISIKFPDWLLAYLEGSLLVLDPNYVPGLIITGEGDTDIHIFNLYLSSLLLSKLMSIDNNESKIPLSVSTVIKKIPHEILSKITKSKRLSKDLANIARYDRCMKDPMTYEELDLIYKDYIESDSINPTYYAKNENIYSCLYGLDGDYFKFALEIGNQNKEHGPFYLTDSNNEEAIEDDTDTDTDEEEMGIIQQYPLFIYRKAYTERGCKTDIIEITILSLLDELSKIIINENNYKDCCGWLVQLSVDTDSMDVMKLENYKELESALHKVVRTAIDLVKSDKL